MPLNLDALRSVRDRPALMPYRYVPGDICALCGAPICAGIAALHRYCPAQGIAPMPSEPRRKRRKAA